MLASGVRVMTHSIRAGIGPFRNIIPGGRHIHHMTFGIVGLLMVGYLWMMEIGTTTTKRRSSRLTSGFYGAGAALTVDEFALWLNLQDVYWAKQGRESIDAVILFGSLLSMGVVGKDFSARAGASIQGRRAPGRGAAGARSQRRRCSYSVELNSQIAIPIISRPSARITAASSSAGTCQPHQVTPGARTWRATGETLRWSNTRRRIGSTA